MRYEDHVPVRLHAGPFENHGAHGQRDTVGLPQPDFFSSKIIDRANLFGADKNPRVGIEKTADQKKLRAAIPGLKRHGRLEIDDHIDRAADERLLAFVIGPGSGDLHLQILSLKVAFRLCHGRRHAMEQMVVAGRDSKLL